MLKTPPILLEVMFPVLSLFLFLDELFPGPTACSQAVEVYPRRQIIYIFYSLFLEFHEKFTETLAKAEIIQYQKGGKNVHAIHDDFILRHFFTRIEKCPLTAK